MRHAASLAAALALALAPAPSKASNRDGLWQGNIGTLPVRACFGSNESYAFGAYFYLSKLKLIPLEQEENAPSAFREGDARDPNNPRWLIRRTGAQSIEGEWTAGGRKLPIRLTAIAARVGEEGPCGSLAFHAPRLEGVRTLSSRAETDGVPYTRLVLSHRGRFGASVESFALDGGSAAIGRINRALRSSFEGNPPEWFACLQSPLATGPNEGDFDESQAPAMIGRRWLSVKYHSDSYCGGNHPNSVNIYRIFDRATGAEVDLLDWMNAEGVKRERFPGSKGDIKTLLPALRKVVIGSWKEEGADCEGVVTGEEFWNVGLEWGLFVFTPSTPHVVQACSETFFVVQSALIPFLTAEGVAAVRALEAEATARGR